MFSYDINLNFIIVTHVAPSKEVSGELGTFTSQNVEANVYITVYAGKVYALDDPSLPKDKTYQQIIPGTKRVIDASHFPKLGTGYRINQTFIDANINVRAYACSKSPKVIISFASSNLLFYCRDKQKHCSLQDSCENGRQY